MFSALYGVSVEMYADNSSNFVGENSELQRSYNLLHSDEAQDTRLETPLRTSWKFSTSWAPHLDGLWESTCQGYEDDHPEEGVGKQVLRNDEFCILLYEAVAVFNSRPLSTLDSVPEDGVFPLTPGHFSLEGPQQLVVCVTSHNQSLESMEWNTSPKKEKLRQLSKNL